MMQKCHCPGLFYGLLVFVLMLAFRPISGEAADFLLKWNPNTENDLSGYYVYYLEGTSVDANLAGATKVTIALDTPGFDSDHPSYTLSGLKDETLYSFAISAYNAAGESLLSGQVSMSKRPGDDGDGDGNDEADPSGTDSTSGSGGGGCFISTVQ